MTPDPQLLTKQVVGDNLDAIGLTIPVRFNLQRGKIARIWGFSYNLSGTAAATIEYSLFVRKTANAERSAVPRDQLWAVITAIQTNGINFGFTTVNRDIMFPKPYRTSGITLQMHASITTTTSAIIIIYYDIDDVAKGELAQRWEKSRGKKYDRRMLSP